MFRRRRNTDEESTGVDGSLDQDPDVVDDDVAGEPDAADADNASGESTRSAGPWDSSEIQTDETYLDLGALRIGGLEKLEVRLEVDEGSGTVVSVAIVDGESTVALQAFAAPRREGMWSDVRKEIAAGMSSSGGTVDFPEGPFGTELHSVMTVQGPDGRQGRAPVRFVGIDGPRWFLRAVINGPAAVEADSAKTLEQIIRGVVVVRGTEAMAPGDQLPLTMPGGPSQVAADEAGGRERFEPFDRGPEITEIR